MRIISRIIRFIARVIKRIFGFIRLIIDLAILVAIIGIIYVGHYIYNAGYIDEAKALYEEAENIVENASAKDFTYSESGTSYYDADGNPILMSYGGRYLRYDEIPRKAIDAIVAIEDRNFFNHKGIDLKGIARAAYQLYESKGSITQGGSTITQQLLKLKYIGSERTYTRKLTEAFCSLLYECKFTKEDIMEYYMNTIYFANGYYGIDAAAYGYFEKDSTQLSTAQLTFILGIPNSPTRYDPYVNPDETKGRQERILKSMLECGYIGEDEYETSVAEDIVLMPKGSRKMLVDNRNGYPFSYIEREAVRTVMKTNGFGFQYEFKDKQEQEAYEKDYETAYAQAKQELSSGCIIHTSISKPTQEKLQSSVDKVMDTINTRKTKEGVYAYQASATCIDNVTGMVAAIVGGRSDKSFLNRAYQSHRQPGSTIKPLIVYTPAIELKGYHADTVVNDHYIKDGTKNANGRYMGDMTLREAVSNSVNTVAWQIFNEIGPKMGLSYIKNMNFTKITKEDVQLASGVGGLTYGVSTLEMASGYAALYNDGKYRTATCIVSIYDAEGNCIYNYDQSAETKKIYKKSAANEMVDIMKSVFEGTAKGLEIDGFCAGKTGTTNDSKDSWFCGMTDKYSTSVWVGRDDGVSMGHGVTGAGYAGKIWNKFNK